MTTNPLLRMSYRCGRQITPDDPAPGIATGNAGALTSGDDRHGNRSLSKSERSRSAPILQKIRFNILIPAPPLERGPLAYGIYNYTLLPIGLIKASLEERTLLKSVSYRSLKYSALIGGLSALFFAPAAFAAGCGKTYEAGRNSLDISSRGQSRTLVYFVPSSYRGDSKVPVVLDFHGSTSTANEQMDRSEWERVAEREGFITVAPQGAVPGAKPGTFGWSIPGVSDGKGPDDIGFIRDAIKTISERFCIDDTKIYGTGYSGGARLLSQYICNGESGFAAAGFVVGLRAGYPREDNGQWHPDTATCAPKAPLSFIAFDGIKDAVNPYDGGGRPYWQYGAKAALDRWVQLNGCDKPEVENKGQVTLTRYEGCNGGARIASYVIGDGGHTWPSSTALLRIQNLVGKVSYEVNATDEAWAFFKSTTK